MPDSNGLFAENSLDADWHLKSLLNHAAQTNAHLPETGSASSAVRQLIGSYGYMADELYQLYRSALKEEVGADPGQAEKIPALMHRVIEKLSEEWERVSQIFPAVLMGDDDVAILQPVIKAAAQHVGLGTYEVAVLPHSIWKRRGSGV
jgi:hypothetical protein